ncbi:metallophosphoesterase family protein [Paenibacillus agricola]|uniref:Metallophosphoesterase family protein n=1 Tax=Paenibacillus agricola TaxID=2716264 RepID=A0ABX0JGT1_9BACL|nr:metallophosphoesterase family protein [Paenibacillus agricola]NHN34474.1 metallophosphoesterase family protein [Paenibacillus agricola]
MKIAFISDIHGNAHALEQVLADIKQKQVDLIYVLGDLCYRGPEPKRSLDLVRALNTEVIKGNADEWVVRGVREGEVPEKALAMMNRERDWTVFHLDPADVDYLKQLPSELHLSIEGVKIHAFHATPHSLFDIIAPGVDDATLQSSLMSAADSQIYVYAHIHKPYIRYLQGKVIINTGSVGLPFDGLPMASYATVEITAAGIRTAIERVHTDVESVVRQYEESRYPNAAMMTNVLRNGSV